MEENKTPVVAQPSEYEARRHALAEQLVATSAAVKAMQERHAAEIHSLLAQHETQTLALRKLEAEHAQQVAGVKEPFRCMW